MNIKILTTVSVLALMTAAPAYADNSNNNQPSKTNSVSEDVNHAWEDIKDDTSEAYKEIKAFFINEDRNIKPTTVTYDERHTATGMIGRPVYNGANERVGTVKDIIVNAQGNAEMVVIADGEFPGFSGKLAVFDYSVISRQNKDGDVIAPLSEESINRAAEFSYDRNERGEKVRVIPDRGYSVSRLLAGQLLNPQGKNVAEIDNVTFRNGKASELVVGFDKILGMGGKNAAMDFDVANLVREGDELDVRLTANQAAQFESYKKTATN